MAKWKEFLVVLVVVGVAVSLLQRERGGSAEPDVESSKAPERVVREPSVAYSPSAEEVPAIDLSLLVPVAVLPQEVLLEDFKKSDGMYGYESTAQLRPPPCSLESLKAGAKLYQENCTACHGKGMAGDGAAGQILDPLPSDLRFQGNYKYGHLELSAYRATTFGIAGTGMAPFGDILEPDEIWKIMHYLRSVQEYHATHFGIPSAEKKPMEFVTPGVKDESDLRMRR